MIFVCVFKYYKIINANPLIVKNTKNISIMPTILKYRSLKRKEKKKDNFLFSFSKKMLDSTMKMKSLTS